MLQRISLYNPKPQALHLNSVAWEISLKAFHRRRAEGEGAGRGPVNDLRRVQVLGIFWV